MGSIVTFARPRPLIRLPKKVEDERESREARQALFILTGAFFATALVMCVVVVVMVSTTWTDVLVMSAFVLVFALLKIVLANALMFAMLRADSNHRPAPVLARTTEWRRLPLTWRHPIPKSGPRKARTGALRLAGGHTQPAPPDA
jgi:protein-S-isoprenylcysteine O-methyltransferase Ste14